MWWGRRLSSGKRGEGSRVNWSTITVVVCTTGSSNMRAADHYKRTCEMSKAITNTNFTRGKRCKKKIKMGIMDVCFL